MAPRAYWKGYLKLSLASCPVQLFPATSDREKIRFHQINRKTGNRIRYIKVDAVTVSPSARLPANSECLADQAHEPAGWLMKHCDGEQKTKTKTN